MLDRKVRTSPLTRLMDNMKTSKLVLYTIPGCGYCHFVARTARQLGIPLQEINILRDPLARQKLLDFRGRATVPVLGTRRDRSEELLGESRVIIAHLKELAEKRVA